MSLIFALDLLDLGSLDRNFSDTNIDMLYIYIYIYIYIPSQQLFCCWFPRPLQDDPKTYLEESLKEMS